MSGVPREVAPSARELLMGFVRWTANSPRLMADEDITMEHLVDMFLLEAELEFNEPGITGAPEDA